MEKKKTLVIGASTNKERYAYLAVEMLNNNLYPVVAVGNKKGVIGATSIETEMLPFNDVDTITLYINPSIQKEYYDYIFSLNPKRIIFNPGTENNELGVLAKQKGVQVLEACTLVLLSTNQY